MDKCSSLGKDCFPGYNLLFTTLDSLRYDAAAEALRANLIPGLKSVLPKDGWELRHSPGNFT